MNAINQVRITIQSLLDSDISAYQIEKSTDVSRAKIGRLRNEKNKVDDLSLATIEKLYNYQKELEKMEDLTVDFEKFMGEKFGVLESDEYSKTYDLGNMYNCRVVAYQGSLDVNIFYKKIGKLAEEFRYTPNESIDKIRFIKDMVIAKSETVWKT